MLVKLTTGVNFTNIIRAAFALEDPKRAKRHWWHECLFVLLWSSRIKASSKHVVEIDPRFRILTLEQERPFPVAQIELVDKFIYDTNGGSFH